MNESKVLIEKRSGIMTATLNRPAKLNAIDNDMARQILLAIGEAREDDQTRVLVLRGAGRAFCAGRDVSSPPTDEDLALVQSVAAAIVALPKPVLAAVHGWTVGAGLEWVLDADVVVAAQSSRFKLPEASLGVFVTGGLIATLPSYAGIARARGLMLFGEEFDAAQAHSWGLIWQVAPDGEFDNAVDGVSARLAALDPAVVLRFKRVINDIGLSHFKRALAAESEAQMELGAIVNRKT